MLSEAPDECVDFVKTSLHIPLRFSNIFHLGFLCFTVSHSVRFEIPVQRIQDAKKDCVCLRWTKKKGGGAGNP